MSANLPKHFALSHAAAAARGGCGPSAKFASLEILGFVRMSVFTHSRAIRANSLIVSLGDKNVRFEPKQVGQKPKRFSRIRFDTWPPPPPCWPIICQPCGNDKLLMPHTPGGNIRPLLCSDMSALCWDGGTRGSFECISKSEVGRRRWLGPAWWTFSRKFSLAEKTGQIKIVLLLVTTHSTTFRSDSLEGAAINLRWETFCYILPLVFCWQ